VVPPDSQRISRVRCYLGTPSGDTGFSRTGLSPSTATLSRRVPLTTVFYDSSTVRQNDQTGPTTPYTQPLPGITRIRFSLFRFRSPLLTESRLFSLPAGTEMFHFPAFPPHALCVQAWVTPHDWGRVSPFGNPWISARLTTPQGLSQSPTSFIGSWCQGIHRVPLITCHKDARIHCAVLKEQPDTIPLCPRLPAEPAVRRRRPSCRFSLRKTLTCSLRTQQRTEQKSQTPRRPFHAPRREQY
jgi:hypothetical protein